MTARTDSRSGAILIPGIAAWQLPGAAPSVVEAQRTAQPALPAEQRTTSNIRKIANAPRSLILPVSRRAFLARKQVFHLLQHNVTAHVANRFDER